MLRSAVEWEHFNELVKVVAVLFFFFLVFPANIFKTVFVSFALVMLTP